MTRLEREIADWQLTRWPNVQIADKYRKLVEEVGELGAALIDGNDLEAGIEAGDIGVILAGLVASIDIGNGPGSLTAWMSMAMDKNRKRGG